MTTGLLAAQRVILACDKVIEGIQRAKNVAGIDDDMDIQGRLEEIRDLAKAVMRFTPPQDGPRLCVSARDFALFADFYLA